MIELTMPALSPTMERGTLAKWLVAADDFVTAGDLVAEIETDKATMEFEAADEGFVAQLLFPEGSEDILVGTVIALLAEQKRVGLQAVAEQAEPAPPLLPIVVADASGVNTAAQVSPLAQRIAAISGIALDGLSGTGPNGKILKADLALQRFAPLAPTQPAQAVPSTAAHFPPPAEIPHEVVKLSAMRKTIAQRLTASKQQIPHFYLTARCNLDPLLELRSQLNADLASQGVRLSVNDLMLKAMAMALVAVPEANVQFGGDRLHRFSRADIAMAVAVDGGLVTPVIKGADSLSLCAIAQRARELAGLARDGCLAPQDYLGGSATLSNLGMFGIDEMVPVINPPQALILGAAAGLRLPWNVNGAIVLATVMSATASFDHRAIDGVTAALFMAAFKERIEQPLLILA